MEIEKICEQTSQLLKTNRSTFIKNDATIILDATYTLPNTYPITKLSQKMENMLNTQNLNTSAALQNASKAPMYKKEDFKIEYVQEEDAEAALKFLKEFFFKDEPLNKSICLGECSELEEYSMKSLKDKCSFKAVNKNGEIAGIFINALARRPPPDYVKGTAALESKDPKFKKILTLMDYIEKDFDVFELYPEVDTILDGKIVAVDGKYRGVGIAGMLTDRTLQYMKENCIPVMSVLCSSHFSYRVMVKLGFTEVYCLNYSDFKVNGEQILKPDPPHMAARFMVKEVLKVKKIESNL